MSALRLIALGLAVLVALLAVPAVRHLREQPPPPPPTLRLALDPPADAELGSGDELLDAAISHDERQIVLVATRAGTTLLWRRELAADRAEPLEGTEGAELPAWSPTDRDVAFFAGGHLRQISLADGAVRDLAEAPAPGGVTWLPNGSILFSPDSSGPLRQLRDGAITDASSLKSTDRAHVFPLSTGAEDEFVYTAVADTGRRTIRVMSRGEERDLETTAGHGALVAGLLLFVRDDTLFARRFHRGTLDNHALRIASNVGVTTHGRGLFVASPRVLLTAAAVSRARALTWFDLTGAQIGTSGEPGDYWQVRVSPDDRDIAVTAVAPLLHTLDIVVVSTAAEADTDALTLALAADSDPVWVDGRRVAFRSLQTGRPSLFAKRVHDRTAQDERVLDADVVPTDWRASRVVYQATNPTSGADIWSVDTRSGTRTALVKSSFNDTDGRWSPDGDWLAYVSDESGRPDIYVNHRSNGTRVRVSFAGGTRPRWARDGRSLFFLRGATIMRTTLLNGSPVRFAPAAPVLDAPGIRDFDVAHRRDALVALIPTRSSTRVSVVARVDWQSALTEQ